MANEEGIARVTFRVRCDSLGYGESVYLVKGDDSRVSLCMNIGCVVCGGAMDDIDSNSELGDVDFGSSVLSMR